jgi:hypothetical protein
MAKRTKDKEKTQKKQKHPPYRTLGEIASKPAEEITSLLENYILRGIKLEDESFRNKSVLDNIQFSTENINKIRKSLQTGISLLTEQRRNEDLETYRFLDSYFDERLELY